MKVTRQLRWFHLWGYLYPPLMQKSVSGIWWSHAPLSLCSHPWLRPIVPVQSSMTAPHVAPPLCWKLPKGRSHIPAPLSPCSHPWLRPCLTKWQFGSQKSIKGLPGWDHLSCLLTGKKTTPHCLLPSLPKMSRFVTGRNSLRRKVRHFQLKFCYFLKSTITAKFPQSPPFSSTFYHF